MTYIYSNAAKQMVQAALDAMGNPSVTVPQREAAAHAIQQVLTNLGEIKHPLFKPMTLIRNGNATETLMSHIAEGFYDYDPNRVPAFDVQFRNNLYQANGIAGQPQATIARANRALSQCMQQFYDTGGYRSVAEQFATYVDLILNP